MLTLSDLDNITSIKLWQWDECCTLAGEIVRGDAFYGTSAAEHDAIDDAHVTTGTEAELARDALATLGRSTSTRYARKCATAILEWLCIDPTNPNGEEEE